MSRFPARQMVILSLCRICEPIAFMSIFPYIYYMIESFHITSDSKQIALYAGMVTSAFAFAEFATGVVWGRLSDRFGRKPILLSGMAGTGVSMIVFGFAPSLPVALIARALGGMLNGNIGVINTTVAEIITEEVHEPFAFGVMPFIWCLGAIIGSGLGGALADPVRNYPAYFAPGTIWERFPYLLPNVVCVGFVLLGLMIGILFLQETHDDLKEKRDIGLETGKWILESLPSLPCKRAKTFSGKEGFHQETLTLMTEYDLPPDYHSTAASPELLPSATAGLPPPAYQSIEICNPEDGKGRRDRSPTPEPKTFNRQVVLIIVGFGILAYHTISAEQLLPVLFSMPRSETPPSLPFKFSGGFDMATKDIGFFLSIQGAIQMIATIVVMPLLTARFGSLPIYRFVVVMYPLLYIAIPYLTLVPEFWRSPCIYLILVWKVSSQALTMPLANLMLKNATPHRNVLGTINGINASAASLSRALGPTVSGLLQSAGLSIGVLGLPWWFNASIASIGTVIAFLVVAPTPKSSDPEKPNPPNDDEYERVRHDEEAEIALRPQQTPHYASDASYTVARGLEAAPPTERLSSPLLLAQRDRRHSKPDGTS
ncbi:hypothetical protein MBLNU230_g1026t1 [Neophaeotheca triangularis]